MGELDIIIERIVAALGDRKELVPVVTAPLVKEKEAIAAKIAEYKLVKKELDDLDTTIKSIVTNLGDKKDLISTVTQPLIRER